MKKILVLLLLLSASTVHGEIYTWKDARGTVFYTNSLDEIPARYLNRARVYDVATGKKGGPATAHPPTPQGQSAVQPSPASPAPATQAPPPAPAPVTVAPSMPAGAPVVVAPVPAPSPTLTAPQSRDSGRERRPPRRRDRSIPEEE